MSSRNRECNEYLSDTNHLPFNKWLLTHIESFKYGCSTGLVQSKKDENNQTTTYTYNAPPSGCSHTDGLNRLTRVDNPDGGWTTSCYDDTPGSPNVTTSSLMNSGGQEIVTISQQDGVGHSTGTTLQSDPTNPIVQINTYDGEGRLYTNTNPYRSTAESTYGTTTHYLRCARKADLCSEPR